MTQTNYSVIDEILDELNERKINYSRVDEDYTNNPYTPTFDSNIGIAYRTILRITTLTNIVEELINLLMVRFAPCLHAARKPNNELFELYSHVGYQINTNKLEYWRYYDNSEKSERKTLYWLIELKFTQP